MQIIAPQYTNSPSATETAELLRYIKSYLGDSRIRQLSPRTIQERDIYLSKLIWFLEHHHHSMCDTEQLREFFTYLTVSHEQPGGRWGDPRQRQPLRPITIRSYYTQYKVFFNWMVEVEEALKTSPMSRLRPPKASSDQINPFSDEHLRRLERAAAASEHPRRNLAIHFVLLDSGMRASELCSLKVRDFDLQGCRCTVLGKGNKRRTVYFGRKVRKALWNYLQEQPRENDDPIFLSDRGKNHQEPLTRSGLRQLIQRLGQQGGVQGVRCSPHTYRHTFAVRFLCAGGNVFSLQQLLGHSNLSVTQRYCALAQGDLENQHRQFSPADRLERNAR